MIDQEALARHEAGHCVAADLLQITVLSVERRWDGGTTMLAKNSLRFFDEALREVAITVLMGPIMEGDENKIPTWPLDRDAEQQDERQLAVMVDQLGLDERGYRDLIIDALKLSTTDEFCRLFSAVLGFVARRPVIDFNVLRKAREIARTYRHRNED